jgi:molybdopterin-guanine dinucleotide biosynthesis protein A
MPLLHHPVLRLAEVTGDVVVVLAPGASEPPMPPGAPVRFARDPQEGRGPLVGAVAGLEIVDRDLAVLAGGDMPGLSVAVVRSMLRVASERPVDAVALEDGDRLRPLPAVVRVGRARDLGRALVREGAGSLRAWLRALDTAVIDEATWLSLDPRRETLRDVDEPSDLDPR